VTCIYIFYLELTFFQSKNLSRQANHHTIQFSGWHPYTLGALLPKTETLRFFQVL
jgi:hypothetical protein